MNHTLCSSSKIWTDICRNSPLNYWKTPETIIANTDKESWDKQIKFSQKKTVYPHLATLHNTLLHALCSIVCYSEFKLKIAFTHLQPKPSSDYKMFSPMSLASHWQSPPSALSLQLHVTIWELFNVLLWRRLEKLVMHRDPDLIYNLLEI